MTTGTQPLEVTRTDIPRWQQALARDAGTDRWIQPERVHEGIDERYAHIVVESLMARTDDALAAHDVILRGVGDALTAECDCPAFIFQHLPCVHVALAVEHLNWWPFQLHPPLLAACPDCGLWCADAADVAEHRAADHTHMCKVCYVSYDSQDALWRHVSLAHNPNRRVVERPTAAAGAALLGRAGGGR